MFLRSLAVFRTFACTCGALGALATAASATADASKSFPAMAVDVPPAAALDFTREPWTKAMPLDGFETLTTRTPAARYPTTARIVLDKENLYVAIHSVQTGTPIVATQSTNNIGFGLDDFVGIGIDTTGNGQSYFFETTPLGIRYQQSVESSKFAPQWTAVAGRSGGDWDALIILPIKILRTPNAHVQRWRFNLIRHIAASNENQTWAYDPQMNDGNFPSFGDGRYWPYLENVTVVGTATKPKPRAEIFALQSSGRDRNSYQQASGAFAPQGTRHLGLDVNVPLTGTIAFVGAVAPDFSNVETDQATISPQEFRRGLSEYRPFFSQGANFFRPVSTSSINSAPNELFYSPGIGPFDRGAKIEGTYKLEQFGALNVAGAGFNDTVLAFKHALSDRSFAYSLDAVSAHHRDGNATAYGATASDVSYDGMATVHNERTGFTAVGEYAGERGSAPGTTPRLAYKSENFLDVSRPNYEFFVNYRDIGPKWNPIDGFTNVADIRGPGSFLNLSSTPAGGIVKRAGIFVYGDRVVDRSGAAHQADFTASLDVLFKNLVHISGGPSFSALRLYDGGASLVGFDGGYRNGVTVPFDQHGVNLGFKEGTPTPYTAGASWGPFATFANDGTLRNTYLRQYYAASARPIGKHFTLGVEFDGTLEDFATADPRVTAHDGQELRRLTIGEALGGESNLSVSLRSISGRGGFGSPGVNLAANFHRRFANDSELSSTTARPQQIRRSNA